MKFVLTYDGPLKANGSPKDKWDIRNHFHPQLKELWDIHPALLRTKAIPYVPTKAGYFVMDVHHSSTSGAPGAAPSQTAGVAGTIGKQSSPTTPPDHINLMDPVKKGGRDFRPVVTNALGLACDIKIQFLRAEPPGRVYQGGDMDNRLKTLFDALAAPQNDNMVVNDGGTDPIFCLLEDDALINSLDVETQRYLSPPVTNNEKHVRLLIEVQVRVQVARAYNVPFLGD